MRLKHFTFFSFLFLQLILLSSCYSEDSASFSDQNYVSPLRKHLVVASGVCYGGGVTMSTGSATISVYSMDGAFERTLVDYNVFSPGDQPAAILDFDEENIVVLVENTSGRRLDLVKKDGSSISTFLTNTTALNGVGRALVAHNDYGFLISKSTAIEKFSRSKARVLQGAAPFVNAPAGSCATSTTMITSVQVLGNGKIVYTHAAASPNNKIALISATGYASAPDCLAAVASPATTALPSASLYHSSGDLLVSYGSTTLINNLIYAYDVNETANTINGATSAYSNTGVIYGPTAMTEDEDTGDVFVASGGFNSIEKFSYDAVTKKLELIGDTAFIPPQVYTRCVSDLKVMDL